MATARGRTHNASTATSRMAGKENIIPSRAPVKHEALPGGAFGTCSAALRPKTSDDFEAALNRAQSGGADLLQIWTDYVLWAQRWPSAEKVVLLRRAVRSLSTEKLYSQDIRLLRLWVMLADKESRPTDIFRQLEDRDIGTHHALLYEAWAHCLETRRDFDAAAEVYRRGLRSLAQPQARLRARRADFDERMRQRVTRLALRRSDPGCRAPQSPRRLTQFRFRTSLIKSSRPHTSELRARLSPQKRQERRKSIMDRRRRSVLLRPKPRIPKEPARLDAATFRRTRATPPINEVALQSARPTARQLRPPTTFSLGDAGKDLERPTRMTSRKQVFRDIERSKTLKRPLEAEMRLAAEAPVDGEDAALAAHRPRQEVGVYSRLATEPLEQQELQQGPASRESVPAQSTKTGLPQREAAAPRRGLLGAWLAPWTGMFQPDDEDICEECGEDLPSQSAQLCTEQTPAKRTKHTWFGW